MNLPRPSLAQRRGAGGPQRRRSTDCLPIPPRVRKEACASSRTNSKFGRLLGQPSQRDGIAQTFGRRGRRPTESATNGWLSMMGMACQNGVVRTGVDERLAADDGHGLSDGVVRTGVDEEDLAPSPSTRPRTGHRPLTRSSRVRGHPDSAAPQVGVRFSARRRLTVVGAAAEPPKPRVALGRGCACYDPTV